jgi:radical SAM protein with 4Fe4S-binding SPASM domain
MAYAVAPLAGISSEAINTAVRMKMTTFVTTCPLSEFGLWHRLSDRRIPLSFDLEVTARCNNACRHCYINLPAGDLEAQRDELSLVEIDDIANQAVRLGSLWCLITGGEPLLRNDFAEIYLMLKKKGLLVSVFTNACLVTEDHVALFKKYPPRDIEVTVYGITKETYEKVTRRPGSYAGFQHGLGLLLDGGIKVRLKAMALRSNVNELNAIAAFCRKYTKDYFRFDLLLHLRYDANPKRNREIDGERLLPAEIAAIEQGDEERASALEKGCDKFIIPEFANYRCDHLFHCGAGINSFVVSYNGTFRLCADLWHPECIYDLRNGRLAQAWAELVPRVRELRSADPEFLHRCRRCTIFNLCLWCPAHAHLETGKLDGFSPYFCSVAQARARAIEDKLKGTNNHTIFKDPPLSR